MLKLSLGMPIFKRSLEDLPRNLCMKSKFAYISLGRSLILTLLCVTSPKTGSQQSRGLPLPQPRVWLIVCGHSGVVCGSLAQWQL